MSAEAIKNASCEYYLDEKWFEELLQIKIKYNKLLSPDFLPNIKRGEWGDVLSLEKLPFYFSALEKEDILATEQKITNLTRLISVSTNSNQLVKKMWLEKMHELGQQVSLLLDLQTLTIAQDESLSIEDVQVKMGNIIGQPNKEIFNLTLAELRQRLKDKNKEAVLTEIGLDTFVQNIKPFDSFFTAFPRVEFSPSSGVNSARIETVQGLKLYMEKALYDIGLGDTWTIKIDKTKKYHRVMVYYKKRKIVLPSVEAFNLNGKKYVVTANKAFRLMVHEIGTHALRSEKGFMSPLKLLSVGLQGYLLGEEGIATFREQQYLSAKKYFAGFQSYLAIGLAYGLDQDGKKRTPYELYTILYKINLALFYKNKTFAKYSAWKRIIRTYITIPNSNSTIINTKDLVYREGNIRIHKLFSGQHLTDEEINVGVYDPCNIEHVSDLKNLGIL